MRYRMSGRIADQRLSGNSLVEPDGQEPAIRNRTSNENAWTGHARARHPVRPSKPNPCVATWESPDRRTQLPPRRVFWSLLVAGSEDLDRGLEVWRPPALAYTLLGSRSGRPVRPVRRELP
jgi:hypothetical protein